MFTLKFYTATSLRESRESVQVEGYIVERDMDTDEVTVQGLKDGKVVEGQRWAMSYLSEGVLRLSRGCVYVMNESGKTIDKYDISKWPIFREGLESTTISVNEQ